MTSGTFVELADLLEENLYAQEAKPQTYLDGKLLVAPAKEITDILTWILALTIYQWIFYSTRPSWWQDTTRYKILILLTAGHFPGPAGLNYDTTFRKDASASPGLAHWCKMKPYLPIQFPHLHSWHRCWSISTSPGSSATYLSIINHPA